MIQHVFVHIFHDQGVDVLVKKVVIHCSFSQMIGHVNSVDVTWWVRLVIAIHEKPLQKSEAFLTRCLSGRFHFVDTSDKHKSIPSINASQFFVDVQILSTIVVGTKTSFWKLGTTRNTIDDLAKRNTESIIACAFFTKANFDCKPGMERDTNQIESLLFVQFGRTASWRSLFEWAWSLQSRPFDCGLRDFHNGSSFVTFSSKKKKAKLHWRSKTKLIAFFFGDDFVTSQKHDEHARKQSCDRMQIIAKHEALHSKCSLMRHLCLV